MALQALARSHAMELNEAQHSILGLRKENFKLRAENVRLNQILIMVSSKGGCK